MGNTNIYKIGVSNVPQERMQALQTANPYKLHMSHVFSADKPHVAESILHRMLAAQRMEGEWFRLTSQQRDKLFMIDVFRDGHFWLGKRQMKLEQVF